MDSSYEKISSENSQENKRKDFLFEISWEVCNKFGGIYTVVSSKLNEIKKYYSNYYTIGVFRENNKEFNEYDEIPEKFKSAYSDLKEQGIILHFGEWNIIKGIKTILIEFLGYSVNLNSVKTKLWELYKIDSLNTYWYDWEEPMLWSWCVGIAIERLSQDINEDVLVQAHEWMSGGSILYLKSIENKERFKTIFTTHATMLGRALCGNGIDLYSLDKNFNPEQKAYEIGVATKFQTEKALANVSDCFTTVSEITGEETELFFNKKPDVLLYNGFDNSKLMSIEKLNLEYEKSRKETNEFLKGYFNDFYEIDTDKTQIFYTSGRYEFKNKGIDIFIKALSKLNEKLIEKKFEKEIIVFFLIMTGEFEKSSEVVNSIEDYKKRIKERSFDFAPLSTHEIPVDNLIINEFIKNELLNKKEDKVKVIFIPRILDGDEKVFGKEYYQMIKGLDYGVFPSYYEPWGYTPLETISYATPTITSDLTGFGRYCQKLNSEEEIISVLKRFKRNDDEVVEDLKEVLYTFTKRTQKELFIERIKAKNFALKFDWSEFIKNYLKAYEIAKGENKE